MSKMWLIITILAIVVGVALPACQSQAVPWSSFLPASFSDVFLSSPLATGSLDYTLSLGTAPTITLNGATYQISSIEGFFVVSDSGSACFTTQNSALIRNWNWIADLRAQQQVVAGYQDLSLGSPLTAGNSQRVHFSKLNIAGSVDQGYDVVYTDGISTSSGYFVCVPQQQVVSVQENAVPETSTPLLAGLGVLVIPTATVLRRRLCVA